MTRFSKTEPHARPRLLWLFALIGCLTASMAAEKPMVVAGEFLHIYDPSVGEKEKWYINDHCFIYGADGLWHLFGITHQEPAAPLRERIFAHATAKTLLQSPWDKQPPALAYAPESPWHEEHLWAPHVVRHDGTYYMFYCAGDRDHSKYKLHLAISQDLKTWTRHPQNPVVVDGFDARDPFVMEHEGKWIMYYTANSTPAGGHHVVKSVVSTNLVDWSGTQTVYTDPSQGTYGGPTESPFVVRRGTHYFLFIGPRPGYDGTDVFVSNDPFSWKIENKVGHIPAHAAEVVRDRDGKWYVSRCGWGRGGVYLAPLTWHDGLENPETNVPVPEQGKHDGAPSASPAPGTPTITAGTNLLPAGVLFQQVDVYVSGRDGYFAYRIPAIETAPDGSLLAFAEGRKHNLHDPGFEKQDIDLVLKRSTDSGQSWSAMQIIEDPGEGWSAANPCTVVDRETGQVWVFYLRGKPGRNTYTARPGTEDIQILARHSRDQGLSWSEPVDLTRVTRDLADPQWRTSVAGPGGGIQDRAGRLAIPLWRFEPWGVFTVVSEDHGRTWRRGAFVADVVGDECQLVELADGRWLLDIRQQRGPHRWRATSADGGMTWSAPRAGEQVTPVACAIERDPGTANGDDRSRLLWTGPKGPGRSNLVLRVSHDEGRTFPNERALSKGPAAYSDLTILRDHSVGVLWERGVERGYEFITFTRFDREW